MAEPTRLKFMKDTLGAPPGQEAHVEGLPCHRGGNTVLSAWKLTDQELLHVVQTRTVLLHVHGNTHAPLAIGVLEPEKEISGN